MRNTLHGLIAVLLFWSSGLQANSITLLGVIDDHTKVDHWTFTLHTQSSLIIDVLAMESAPEVVDFFGNGADNDHLDSMIYLFEGTTAGTLLGVNDDSNDNLGLDGSTTGLDSYLSFNNLAAGDYVLAIGDWILNEADARNGFNTGTEGTLDWLGHYQVTLTADQVSSVPLPPALPLFVLGLVSLIRMAKR